MKVNTVIQGDCLSVMRGMDDNSVSAVVTDPPYGISFMGKKWDYDVPSVEVWRECLRVLKPGGHLLSFAGTRTYHRMTVNIEDAGFEIRDMIAWVYGSGFPKSHNIGKAVDRLQGNKRKVLGTRVTNVGMQGNNYKRGSKSGEVTVTEGNSSWEGWGSAIKPSQEPLILATKPLIIVPESVILSVQHLIGALLWELLLPAKRAELISALSHHEPREVCVSAHIIAGVYHLIRSGWSLEKMAMSKSLEADKIICNIVELWDTILGVNYSRQNTFTTSMALSLTTELKTLSLLAYQIIQKCTTKERLRAFGVESNVITATSNSAEEQRISASLITAQDAAMLLKELNTVSSADQSFMVAGNIVNTVLQNAITPLEERISPNLEPIVLTRKPLSEKTIALNVLKWGTGGINIDGCRIGTDEETRRAKSGHQDSYVGGKYDDSKYNAFQSRPHQGRFPANFIHDGSQEVLDLFPDTKSGCKFGKRYINKSHKENSIVSFGADIGKFAGISIGDSGSASRFFYCAKASKRDRDEGLEEFALQQKWLKGGVGTGKSARESVVAKNFHPTVKPTKLMQYLVRLITPPDGVVLDPFGGSGSTGKACIIEGFRYILIEREEEYCEIARKRLSHQILELK